MCMEHENPQAKKAKHAGKDFLHYPEDFGALVTKPLHFDMTFDMTPERAIVTTNATYNHTGDADLAALELDSKGLEIKSVEMYQKFDTLDARPAADFPAHVASLADPQPVKGFELDAPNAKLLITFVEPVKAGAQFVLRLVSVARPTENILEGIYYDYTPKDCPRTMITQCQQYGFQRIVPSMDRMAAKMYYTTTIIADKAYTNVITNGDLAPGFFDEKTGLPIYHPAPEPAPEDVKVERHMLKYHNHLVCMAPYLFFLGVGTYVTYRKLVEYPDGDSFIAELLVFPGLVKPEHAHVALNALHDSILWNYLSAGPEAYDHEDERTKLYALIDERQALLEKQTPTITASDVEAPVPVALSAEEDARLAAVRAEMKELIQAWTKTGYKYTGQVYREIAMQNSDYGGMENVGNTTILSSRLVPSDKLSDAGYLYMEGVKIHEYYHNINGSQVTGQSPFEIWLNEAVTVHVQREREDVLFGHDFMRLRKVIYANTPATGPLALDNAPTSMAVEPDGFNRTQELISAMTYSKAPEFVRMVQLVIGKRAFVKGLDLYHTKFSWGNARTADWIKSMEEASGVDLQRMANTWLKRTGFPRVEHTTKYDAATKTVTVSITQTGFERHDNDAKQIAKNNTGPWDFPVDWALVKDGKNMQEGVFRVTEAKSTLTIENVDDEPDFVSFARDWSFFGTSRNGSADEAALTKQALSDPDVVNRYLAFRALADAEKARVIECLAAGKKDHVVSSDFVKLHARILFDDSITPSTRALMLREAEEIPSRPDLGHLYIEIAGAKHALLQAVWDAHAPEIAALYHKIEAANVPGPHKDGLHDRALKHHLFALIESGCSKASQLSTRAPTKEAEATKVDVPALASALLFKSSFNSDQTFGFAKYLESNADDVEQVQKRVRDMWVKHPDDTENYIRTLASLNTPRAPVVLRALLQDPVFNINLSGHARTLARGWMARRKLSLLSDDGLALTVDIFVKIAKVNQMSAQPFISAFNDLAKFDAGQQAKLVAALRQMQAGLDSAKEASMYNQLTTILKKY